MNATISDLYGGTSLMSANRDVSIQPFATSSILQHHYLATGSVVAGGVGGEFNDGAGVKTDSDSIQTMANSSATDAGAQLNKVAGGSAPNGGQVSWIIFHFACYTLASQATASAFASASAMPNRFEQALPVLLV